MTIVYQTNGPQGTILCKSCGLCCTGHLFIWTKLRSVEMDPAEKLGLKVIRSHPRQRGFNQPCLLWHGQCTVYTSPHYPQACRSYKCKLLRELFDEITDLPNALRVVEQAREMIHDLDGFLPASPTRSFRELLVAHIKYMENAAEQGNADLDFLVKANALLTLFENRFGVKDLIDQP